MKSCRPWMSRETMEGKKEYSSPAIFSRVSFHISLNKLCSHFLIHWIGDDLLLLLTSLGPKMKFTRRIFFAFLLLIPWSGPSKSLRSMKQIKLTDFDLSIGLLTNGFMIGIHRREQLLSSMSWPRRDGYTSQCQWDFNDTTEKRDANKQIN